MSEEDIDEDPRSAEDRRRSPIGAAIGESQDVLRAGVEGAGGRVLAILTIVHAEGVTPSGGLEVYVDEKAGGPQSPDDVLAFALQGVGALASRYDLPFAVMDVTGEGGQG